MEPNHVNELKHRFQVAVYYFRKHAKCEREQLLRETHHRPEREGLARLALWCERCMRKRLLRYQSYIKRLQHMYSGLRELKRLIRRLDDDWFLMKKKQERRLDRIRG